MNNRTSVFCRVDLGANVHQPVGEPAPQRLTDATLAASQRELQDRVRTPDFHRAEHAVGIVHLGPGAFHRAHQALCTDTAIAASGGDWRILGASLRSHATVAAVEAQDGLYSVLERDGQQSNVRVVGSLAGAIAAAQAPEALRDWLARPATRIVSLTVTEKAYRDTAPGSVIASLVGGLAARRHAGLSPYTVLCCDNLEANGQVVREAVLAHADSTDPALARWIASEGAFPSSMVDRIVPAATDTTRRDAREQIGLDDPLAVETEPFFQWVMEDHFVNGRPDWDAGGAVFVDDVTPWERAKLTMLNGAHTLIACFGLLLGHETVAEVVAHPALRALVRRHMHAAAATLPSGGPEPKEYTHALLSRFDNTALRHRTAQIAMDSSEKVPKRWLGAASRAITSGQDTRAFAFAMALWLRWSEGQDAAGTLFAIEDPRADVIARIGAVAGNGQARLEAAIDTLGWNDVEYFHHADERRRIGALLDRMHKQGIHQVVENEMADAPAG